MSSSTLNSKIGLNKSLRKKVMQITIFFWSAKNPLTPLSLFNNHIGASPNIY